MQLNMNELRDFLEVLIKKAETSGFAQMELNHDFYWNLPPEDSFNFTNQEPQMTVGSLDDDYTCLKQMLKDDLSTPLDFERLGHLLLAISHLIGSSDQPFIC